MTARTDLLLATLPPVYNGPQGSESNRGHARDKALVEHAYQLEKELVAVTESEKQTTADLLAYAALTIAIDATIMELYPGSEATGPEGAIKRVKMLKDDVLCGRENFTITNRAYVEKDERCRKLEYHIDQMGKELEAYKKGENNV